VIRKLACPLWLSLVAVFLCALTSAPGTQSERADQTPPTHLEKVVFLGGELAPEELLLFTAAMAASGNPGVALLDSARIDPYQKAFLASFQPERVIPVGLFPHGPSEVERRLEVKPAPGHATTRALARSLFPKAERVVICAPKPRGLLLQAACLSGALRAPLFVDHGTAADRKELRQLLIECGAKRVYAVSDVKLARRELGDPPVTHLADEPAVAALYLKHLLKQGPVRTLVVANPDDDRNGLGGMASLAPWIALQKRGALLLTNPAGNNVEHVVQAALESPALRDADVLLLVAGLKAIPTRKRPNPIPGDKDPEIEMEPCTPQGQETYTFATGRLFHDDLAVVPLMLARERLLREQRGPRRALVASNPGGSLPLLETFSRNTIQELRNAGYETQSLIGHSLTRDALRRKMPQCDVFLWEGHHNTLIKEWNMPEWNEPLPSSLIFLQSCLALQDWKAQPLLSRGAIGVVGTSTRTYSGSGGAYSLAFFNALLYEDATLGGALRQAKNFLLAYSMLKEKRLGADAKRTGANLRAAWSFTLWGDPTLHLPRPPAAEDALAPVRHAVHGKTITLLLPPEPLDKVKSARFQAQMPPNARLAGLVRKEGDADGQPLVPFVFAEVQLPKGPPGATPILTSRMPSSHWVFCWDGRRRCGYLLATPRDSDREELRFHVEWQTEQMTE
jgi:hypothetical protein